MKKTFLTILLCGVMVLSLTGCGKSSVEDAKKDLQESQERHGYVEKETVDVLVAKFNTEVEENPLLIALSFHFPLYIEKHNFFDCGWNNNRFWIFFLGNVTVFYKHFVLIILFPISDYL